MTKRRAIVRLILVVMLIISAVALAVSWTTGRGNWDLSRHSIPLSEIVSGGPSKDGIPAILEPRFVPASEAGFLAADDRILGLQKGSETKAYPVKILNWHEIVNDRLGGRPVVVTYCPLCGTGIGFDSTVDGRVHTFGVSGMLYQSDLLMYDHQTETLWSQVLMQAVAGPQTGQKLTPMYLVHTTWGAWKRKHPSSLVLSDKTGYLRSYDNDPYDGYALRRDLLFDVRHFDPTYHPKAWVVGVDVRGAQKAYAFSELDKLDGPLTDRVNGTTIRVHFDKQARSATVTDEAGEPFPSVMAFWFAWYAFHPDTAVFTTK